MSVDPLAFLDQPESSSGGNDPLSFLDEPPSSPLRKPARHVAQAGKGALNLIPAVAAYNLATTLERAGAHKSRRRVSEQARKDLERMDEKISRGEPLTRTEGFAYDRTKRLAERKSEKAAAVDTESLINKGVRAATGINLEPEDLGEEITNIASALVSPRRAIGAAKKIPKLLSRQGRADLLAARVIRKADAPWKALEKTVKGNPEKEGIVNFARQRGLNPKETTMLLQSEKRIEDIGRVAKKTKKFEKDIAGLKEKLGASYDEVKEIGRKGGYASEAVTRTLEDDLRVIERELGLTHFEGPDTEAAKRVLNKAITDLEVEGTTFERLLNTHQNLGQGINWNNVGPKGFNIKKIEGAVEKAMQKTNPKAYEQFKETDKAYRTYLKFQDVLDKKQGFITIRGIRVPSSNIALGGAALGAKALLGISLPKTLGALAAKEGIQRLATAMLTNPKLQGVHRKLMQAVLNGDKERQRKLMVVVKKILKSHDPELYEELQLEV